MGPPSWHFEYFHTYSHLQFKKNQETVYFSSFLSRIGAPVLFWFTFLDILIHTKISLMFCFKDCTGETVHFSSWLKISCQNEPGLMHSIILWIDEILMFVLDFWRHFAEWRLGWIGWNKFEFPNAYATR